MFGVSAGYASSRQNFAEGGDRAKFETFRDMRLRLRAGRVGGTIRPAVVSGFVEGNALFGANVSGGGGLAGVRFAF